ncbi:MAG: FAD-dependent 5-carboxymethylaminomethyl-2-thiouridine(34) oxidoreductase MnmC, partial [Halioglobus sp.]|nr:FAD-dependent 5-carboxymethylaminomethyl-2-thiouridine(34) oxidoreductase MnmC [Halioglobus sp.]
GKVHLDLWLHDATQTLAELAKREQKLVDAWYLDGFAPNRNADMWSLDLFRYAAAISQPAATVATFTVAGRVRRGLQRAGFQIEKCPGFGRKRECLRGRLQTAMFEPAIGNKISQWDLPTTHRRRPRSALIVGAGPAGCCIAAALADRDIDVTVLERSTPGGAVGAVDQGILFTRLSRKHSALNDFSVQSYHYATNFYRNLFTCGRLTAPSDGELCGSFQQADNPVDLHELAAALEGLEDFAQVLDAEQASERLGIAQHSAGFWFPGSGWLDPKALCRALLIHPRIHLEQECGDVTIDFLQGQWQAVADDRLIAAADCAVVAAGPSANTLQALQWLPLQAIRGQVTLLPSADWLSGLRAALCHEGYITPARAGRHCIGATYDIGSVERAVRSTDHRHNLDKLSLAVPAGQHALAALDTDALAGATGIRCASPDYLPIVGQAPDLSAFLARFASLRKNARHPACKGVFLPGLFLSTAHGSRGLTSAPLSAELLASMICHEPLPLARSLCRALAPARFIIRDLIRNRM